MAKSLIHSDSLPVRVALQYHTRPLRLWDVLFGGDSVGTNKRDIAGAITGVRARVK